MSELEEVLGMALFILVYIEIIVKFFFFISEKATSPLLLEPDWQSIIQICDIICQGDCQ